MWFALRRKSLCFWSWYRKCVLSTLDSQFFSDDIITAIKSSVSISEVLAITAHTCWQFITFLIINWPFAPTIVCSVACKAPRKCLHMKLISKSEQNLTSWMLLIFLQLTPWLVYYLLQILCEFERQLCAKTQGNVSSFICDKQFYLRVQTQDSDAVAFSPYSSAAFFLTLLTSVASIEKCIKFFSLTCNKYLIHNWTQVWVFSALTFYNLSCLLWWVQTLSIY